MAAVDVLQHQRNPLAVIEAAQHPRRRRGGRQMGGDVRLRAGHRHRFRVQLHSDGFDERPAADRGLDAICRAGRESAGLRMRRHHRSAEDGLDRLPYAAGEIGPSDTYAGRRNHVPILTMEPGARYGISPIRVGTATAARVKTSPAARIYNACTAVTVTVRDVPEDVREALNRVARM